MSALHLKDPSKDRYHAISISSVWELPRIRNACALVVGAGALGNEVSKNLAMMGVRAIVVLDRDTVEVANLSRSVFFRETDHGRPKAEVIAERLRDLNPDVEILPLRGDLESVLGLGLLRRMDMVFSCLDSRLARRNLNRMCEKLAKGWVDGAMENLLGDVTAYMPDLGPCYECNLTVLERSIIAEGASCRVIAMRNLALGKVPTTSTMGSIIAAIEVQEGIKLLHGDLRRALIGKRMVFNCEANDVYVTRFDRAAQCEGHFRFGPIAEAHEFTAGGTTARELLGRFQSETGDTGVLELGREIVVGMSCPVCRTAEALTQPVRIMTEAEARCPVCGEIRLLRTTHLIRGDEPYADYPLERVGVPKLEVLEVRGSSGAAWYEMTGDLAALPEAIGGRATPAWAGSHAG